MGCCSCTSTSRGIRRHTGPLQLLATVGRSHAGMLTCSTHNRKQPARASMWRLPLGLTWGSAQSTMCTLVGWFFQPCRRHADTSGSAQKPRAGRPVTVQRLRVLNVSPFARVMGFLLCHKLAGLCRSAKAAEFRGGRGAKRQLRSNLALAAAGRSSRAVMTALRQRCTCPALYL